MNDAHSSQFAAGKTKGQKQQALNTTKRSEMAMGQKEQSLP